MKDPISFWEKEHSSREVEWLTGSTLEEYLYWYRIDFPKNLDITEIGVGLGVATRQLIEYNRVTAVDISNIALEKLNCNKYHTDNIKQAPPADLAICHLVFQHCTLDQIDNIMNVPLKEYGIFCFQFARPETITVHRDTKYQEKQGYLIWHKREDIVDLLNKHNLIPFWESNFMHCWRGDNIEWTMIKAKRG